MLYALAMEMPSSPGSYPSANGSRDYQLYRQLKQIEVGGEGGWDYLTIDSAAQRLYISRCNTGFRR